MGLDEHGHAMHRHLGNVVYPEPMVNKYGADAFRLWTASESKLGSNYLFSESRVAGARKFITKLWNVAKFISQFEFPKEGTYKLEPIDIAILEKLDDLILECKNSFKQLDPFDASKSIRYFVWDLFAGHYIEAVKPRVYNRDNDFKSDSSKGAIYTLYQVLDCVIKLLAPIAPFVTEEIYQKIPHDKKSINLEDYPIFKGYERKYSTVFDKFMQVNSLIWNYKKTKSLSLASAISELCLTPKLEVFGKEIVSMHKAATIRYDFKSIEGFEKLSEDVYIKL
jgi:valyl-tRNA synthetase